MTKSLIWLSSALVMLVSGISTAFPAVAQTAVDPLEDLQTNDNSSNPFEGDSGSAQRSIFDMIHRSVLGNGTSIDDFNEARSENIDEQAGSFREQRQRLLNQDAETSGSDQTGN